MTAGVTHPTEKLTPKDWEQVYEQTQAILAPMVHSLHGRLPTVLSDAGKTSTELFPLFSYRDFLWPDEPDLEAVCVGLDFHPSQAGAGIRVRGSIVGEETGHTYFDAEEKEVPETFVTVLAAATDVAGQLSTHVDVLVEALNQRRLPPDYRGLRSERP